MALSMLQIAVVEFLKLVIKIPTITTTISITVTITRRLKWSISKTIGRQL